MRRLYLKVYGCEASDTDVAKALVLIDDVDRLLQKREAKVERRRLAAWSSLCQVVVSANEFIQVQ